MINIGGYRILADPVFEKRVSVLGPSRFNGEVPVDIEAGGTVFDMDSVGTRSTNYTCNATSHNSWHLTATADFTLYASNMLAGMTYYIVMAQDATGGHTITLSSDFGTQMGGETAIDEDLNAISIITLVVYSEHTRFYTITWEL